MNNWTAQDYDIGLYTLAELKIMMKILDNPNSTAYVPFNYGEIKQELIKRQNN